MRDARRVTRDSGRATLLMLVGLGALASLALVLSACGGSSDNGETTTGAGSEANGEEMTTGTESQAAKAGAQVFASAGCGSCHTFKAAGSTGTVGPNLDNYLEPDDNKPGIEEMIVDPNSEIAEGYSADVMPQNFGETLDAEEVRQLIAFLYENSSAHEKPEGEQAEEEKKEGK